MRYLFCFTWPEPVRGTLNLNAIFKPGVEVGDFASDKEAIAHVHEIIRKKSYEDFTAGIDAIIRDDPAKPENICTIAVKTEINERQYLERRRVTGR
jgi:hypothetical protein